MKLHFLGSLALLAAPAAAQSSTFTAVIDQATMPSFCMEETHFIECNGTLLKSTTLDLDKYVGKPYLYSADLVGVECDIWNVTSVAPPRGTLTFCGSAVPGCPVRFRVGPSGVIGQWFLWWSAAVDFTPLSTTLGTLMLAPPFHFLGSGMTFGPTETFETSIPQSPGLVGVSIYAQGAFQDVGPIGPLGLTNQVCFTILPPMPPCIQPGC